MAKQKITVRSAGKNVRPEPFQVEYLHPDIPIFASEETLEHTDNVFNSSHFHDEFEWIRVLSGTLQFEVNGEEKLVQKGETLFINSRQVHIFYGCPEGTAVFRVLLAKPDFIRNPCIEKQLSRMIQDSGFSSVIIRPVNPLFSADMDAILELSQTKPQAYEFSVLSHYLEQLRQIIRIYEHANPDETIRRNTDIDSLREMMAYIGEHYQEPISLDELAAAGKMSRSKCTKLFRQYVQQSPVEHIQNYRLERCIYLLNNTDMTCAEIAMNCGFNEQSYFNRLFLRKFNMSPKKMREQHRRRNRSASQKQR